MIIDKEKYYNKLNWNGCRYIPKQFYCKKIKNLGYSTYLEIFERFMSMEYSDHFKFKDKIYTDWILPDYIDLIDKRVDFDLMKKEYVKNDIIELNSKLRGLKINDIYSFNFGIISKFNLDDILYFLEYDYIHRPKETEDLTEYVNNKYNYTMEWVASHKTLNRIIKNHEINI